MKTLSGIALVLVLAGWSLLVFGTPSIPDDGFLYCLEFWFFSPALVIAVIARSQPLSKITFALILVAAVVAYPIKRAHDREIAKRPYKIREKMEKLLIENRKTSEQGNAPTSN